MARRRKQWMHGYAVALANVYRVSHDRTLAVYVITGDGISLLDLVRAGADPHDTDALADAFNGEDPTSAKARGN